MPRRGYNFSKRRDLAGGAGFPLVCFRAWWLGVTVGLEPAPRFGIVERDLEADHVRDGFILCHAAARTFV